MKTKLLIIITWIVCMLPICNVHAQAVDWDVEPVIHSVPDSLKGESAVIIQDDRKLQLKIMSDNDIYYYRTSHRIVKVMDDKGIELFNKITLSADKDGSMLVVKARTITPQGKVIEVPDSNIKQSNDEDGDTQYSIAFEGVEKNAELELFYAQQKPFSAFGSEYFSFGYPTLTASFVLESPSNIVYRIKGYNGYPNPTSLQVGDVTYYRAVTHNVPAMDEEQYSDFEKNMMRIEYRFDSVVSTGKKLYTWNMLAGRMQEMYGDFRDKDLRNISKFLKQNGFDQQGSVEDQIIKIESIIKTNISYNEQLKDDQYNTVEEALSKKTCGEDGFLHLFTAAFQSVGIRCDVGLTSNYFTHPVDVDFPNWSPLEIYLLYFPDTKQYLAPAYITLRYPMVPLAACNNTGIFVNTADDNGIADMKLIPEPGIDQSGFLTNVDVQFNKDNMIPTLSAMNAFKGYSALSLREAFVYAPKDKMKDLVQALVFNAEKPENIISYKVSNQALENYTTNKPLEITSEVEAAQLVEHAGSKILFKVGQVIGPQVQMYDSVKRRLPISVDYPHTIKRNITIEIPEGYTIKNPDAAKINITNSKDDIGFVSDYKMDGGKMIIHINEYYGTTQLPISEIDNFRKVINAAADFNKVILVLEKK